jgi:hypothetical protein
MSTETPIDGAALTTMVLDGRLSREAASSALAKLAFAIKRKQYVTVMLYGTEPGAVVKIYPLDQKQAEFLNHRAGEVVHIPASDWKHAYDTNPLPKQ